MTNEQGLEGCSRCPICHDAPSEKVYESTISGELLIELICQQHQSMIAMGRTLEEAAHNFNILVDFFKAGGFAKVA